MHLKIQKLNKQIINKSLEYFSKDFVSDLKNKSTFEESLVARYLIEKNKNKFSSISHKKDLVFVGTSYEKIGVDIEKYRERDLSLLDKFSNSEYSLLGGKNWNNFYILWTAKESIIKLENILLDDMDNIVLKKSEKIKKTLSGIEFLGLLEFEYNGKNIEVINGYNKDIFYSICYYNK